MGGGGDRGVGMLLWKIKDILSNVLRTRKYDVLGEKTRPEQSTQHKKLLKISPPCAAISPTLNLSEIHCLYLTVRILHFAGEISNRSS